MTARARLLLGGTAVLGPLLAFPTLLVRPKLGIAAVLVVLVAFLATRSVAFPIALWGLPGVVIGLAGTNPFPNDSVEIFLVAWAVLALVLALVRDEQTLPLKLIFAPPILLTLALALLMLARLGPSLAPSYGSYKLQLFLAEGTTFLVAGILIGRRARHVRVWVWCTLATSALGALVLVRGLVAGSLEEALPGRFALYAQAGPIPLARAAALGILLAVFLLISSRVAWQRLVALALMPALAVAFLGAGSRGPVLGLLVALAVLLVLTVGDRLNRRRLLLLGVAGLATVALVPQLVPGQNVDRSLSVLFGGDDSGGLNANGRIDQWRLAWEQFGDHPLLGIGTGSFARLDPIGIYPHNLLLEVASELGFVGVAIVLALLAFAVSQIGRVRRYAEGDDRTQAALVGAVLAAGVTNSMFSGDIPNNALVWLACGLAAGMVHRVVPADVEGEAWRRIRSRWRRSGAGPVEPLSPGDPSSRGPLSRGEAGTIAAPADGGTVAGEVRIAVVPPQRGWTGAVAVEYSAGGQDWRHLAIAQGDEEFDVHVVLRHGAERKRQVAAVRNARRANDMRAALEAEYGGALERVEIRPTRRRSWSARDLREATWDTREVEDGAYRLRAVSSDASGRTVASDEVTVHVDNTPPAVRFDTPQQRAILIGVTEVSVSARDAGSGVDYVAVEWAGPGEEWKSLATVREAPFKAAWNTPTLDEGDYRLRASAYDRAGNCTTSGDLVVRVERVVSAVTLEDPGHRLARTVRLRASVRDEGRVSSVEFQVAETNTFGWRALACADSVPFEVDVDTLRLGDGVYDLRAVARAKDGSLDASRVRRQRIVHNVPPTVTLLEPQAGSTLRGAVPLSARAVDSVSGVLPVLFQFSADGATWRPVVTRTDGPSTVTWETSRVQDGDYRVRAVAGDAAGNLTPSEPVVVHVDNTPPLAMLDRPEACAELEGIVGVKASVEDGVSGVLAVRYETSPDGSAWRELAVVTAPPWGTRWDTLMYPDGVHFIRCVARDRAGNVTTTEPRDVRIVNHEPPPAPEAFEPVPPKLEPIRVLPAPAVDPAAPVGRTTNELGDVGSLSIWQLERLLARLPHGDRRDELDALLYTLRAYARPDGSLPERFVALVQESFGDPQET